MKTDGVAHGSTQKNKPQHYNSKKDGPLPKEAAPYIQKAFQAVTYMKDEQRPGFEELKTLSVDAEKVLNGPVSQTQNVQRAPVKPSRNYYTKLFGQNAALPLDTNTSNT